MIDEFFGSFCWRFPGSQRTETKRHSARPMQTFLARVPFSLSLLMESLINLHIKITILTLRNFDFDFLVGVVIEVKPKSGECERVCCDGQGGEMTVERVCTPSDKCHGFDTSDKEDKGYCPGETNAYCECSKGKVLKLIFNK